MHRIVLSLGLDVWGMRLQKYLAAGQSPFEPNCLVHVNLVQSEAVLQGFRHV